MKDKTRKTGIDVIGAVPWGTHLCLFYDTKQDLIDVLVPYFKAGLENNEFCIWVTSPLLIETEAEEALRQAVPDFDQYLAGERIAVIPDNEWYLKDGIFDPQRVLQAWLDKLEQALAAGCDGMRVTGDTARFRRRDWAKFIDYEKTVNDTIGDHPMLALCAYPLHKYRAREVMEVEHNHQFSLFKHNGALVLIGGSQHEQAEDELYGFKDLLEKTLTSHLDATLILDVKSPPTIIDCNPRATEIFGYTRQEMLGRTITFLHVDEAALERFKQHLDPAVEERGFLHLPEFSMKRKDGTIFPTRHSVVPRSDRQGNRIGWVSVIRDMTAHKQLEEEKRREIAELALDGFWIIDLKGRFLEVNDSYCQMIGYTPEELLKMSIRDIEAVESPEEIRRRMKKIAEQGFDHFETRHRRKDGRIIDVEINVNYLDLEEGRAFVAIGDITGRKRARETRETNSQLLSKKHMTLLQQRFAELGFEGFGDRDIIELLLSLSLSRRESHRVAEECLKEFKDLRGFLSTSTQELERVGVTSACMFCIKLLRELPAEILKQKIIEQPFYKSSQEVFDYLYYSMRDLKKEVFKVIYLNSQNQIIETVDLFEGSPHDIHIHPREVVQSAITHGAVGVIFVHNHPSGDPAPSKSDKQLTRDLVFIGTIIQIKVLDHIIIGGNRYFSFADEGLINKCELDFLNLRIRRVSDRKVGYSRRPAKDTVPTSVRGRTGTRASSAPG